MNVKFAVLRSAVVAGWLVAAATMAVAGPIDPPAGPVGSTHKTLTEVEPRIAVNAVNTPGTATAVYRIAQPGSYYLTENITGQAGKSGIVINSDDVTLDLNGFAVIGVLGSVHGVDMPSGAFRRNVVVKNGNVRGWGGSGVSTRIEVGRIERISSASNGGWGIDNNASSFTTHIIACEVLENLGGGIRGGDCSNISECVASRNTGFGIAADLGSSVAGCTVRSTAGIGIQVQGHSSVLNNTSSANTGADGDGIRVQGNGSRIEGNTVTANASAGVRVVGTGNIIVKNWARPAAGGTAYVIASGSHVGQIVTGSGTIPTTVSPWANFAQ